MGEAPSITKEILVCNITSIETGINRKRVWPEYWDIPQLGTDTASRALGTQKPCPFPLSLSLLARVPVSLPADCFLVSQFPWQNQSINK